MEYKTIKLTTASTAKHKAKVEERLNKEAKDGWVLHNITAHTFFGFTDGYLAIFERNK